MKDRLNKDLEIGDNVLILAVPVKSSHEFIEATITGFTSKMVEVKTGLYAKDRYDYKGRDERVHHLKRYPEQVIKIEKGEQVVSTGN